MFCDTKAAEDPKKVLRKAVGSSLSSPLALSFGRVDQAQPSPPFLLVAFATKNQDTILDMKIMVLGMPNVGKSTLLNQLRNVGMKKGSSRLVSFLFVFLPLLFSFRAQRLPD